MTEWDEFQKKIQHSKDTFSQEKETRKQVHCSSQEEKKHESLDTGDHHAQTFADYDNQKDTDFSIERQMLHAEGRSHRRSGMNIVENSDFQEYEDVDNSAKAIKKGKQRLKKSQEDYKHVKNNTNDLD